MKRNALFSLLYIVIVGMASASYAGTDELSPVYGWAERVIVDAKHQFILTAKLDTGADTSSLDARDMKRVRYKGKSYVRFTVTDPVSGESVSLRKPYVRRIRVKRHDGDHQRRYVVKMTICVGDKVHPIDVSLIDRGVFEYPMLLGRQALRRIGWVNPREHFTKEPICRRSKKEQEAFK